MISTSWLLVSFVLAAALPSLAEAQIPYGAPAPAYAPEERARLLARTDTELAVDPIPADPVGLALELALLEAQLDEIDVTGTNILQWWGA